MAETERSAAQQSGVEWGCKGTPPPPFSPLLSSPHLEENLTYFRGGRQKTTTLQRGVAISISCHTVARTYPYPSLSPRPCETRTSLLVTGLRLPAAAAACPGPAPPRPTSRC